MGQSTKQTFGIIALVLILVVAVGYFAMGGYTFAAAPSEPTTPVTGGAITPIAGYVPHALTSGFSVFAFNAEDRDAVFGANDVAGKIWEPNTADWTGPFVVSKRSLWILVIRS